mmetsp:Transcript_5184/g.6124  ORF Transcript_5184/g.6124 Transcript_5184/m.6124 type:complete len:112 (-) Transcript_5184:561-896(-)
MEKYFNHNEQPVEEPVDKEAAAESQPVAEKRPAILKAQGVRKGKPIKFNPKLHKKPFIFEKKGFVGTEEMKNVLDEDVTFIEKGIKFTKSMADIKNAPQNKKPSVLPTDFK